MESQREQILHDNNLEKEDILRRADSEHSELSDTLIALQRERDDQLLDAENDKQQVRMTNCYQSLLSQFCAEMG